jgi:hypothetical protein
LYSERALGCRLAAVGNAELADYGGAAHAKAPLRLRSGQALRLRSRQAVCHTRALQKSKKEKPARFSPETCAGSLRLQRTAPRESYGWSRRTRRTGGLKCCRRLRHGCVRPNGGGLGFYPVTKLRYSVDGVNQKALLWCYQSESPCQNGTGEGQSVVRSGERSLSLSVYRLEQGMALDGPIDRQTRGPLKTEP